MATLRQLVENKGGEVWSVSPDDSVYKALEEMARRNGGCVLVMEGGKIVGIFTERDYARNVILKGKSSPKTAVREVMTDKVICVRPEQTVEEAMAVMSDKRVRHLPVMEDGKLLGLLSIGDLVSSIISEQKFTIEQLQDFIRA
ncbi:MAG: CBS domain-containing protein [Rhodospirillales bacterium]|nr:CBS domain-containing protein [Rhodospirillales bacterium]